jgi:hypothetical protein
LNIGRKKRVTYKRGGAIESDDKVDTASKLPGDGGEACQGLGCRQNQQANEGAL